MAFGKSRPPATAPRRHGEQQPPAGADASCSSNKADGAGSHSLANLGRVQLQTGDEKAAFASFRESFDIGLAFNYQMLIAYLVGSQQGFIGAAAALFDSIGMVIRRRRSRNTIARSALHTHRRAQVAGAGGAARRGRGRRAQ